MHQPQQEEEEMRDPELLRELRGHKQAVMAVDFSHETAQMVSGGEDNCVILWNLSNIDVTHPPALVNSKHNERGARLYEHKVSITSVAFGLNYLISASRDGQTKLWRIDSSTSTSSAASSAVSLASANGQCFTYNSHTTTVRSVACSQDYPMFCTASDDKSIKVWSANNRNKMIHSFRNGHRNWIKCVRWSKKDPHLIASCGDDRKLCIWDTRSPCMQPILDMQACRPSMQFNCLDWHPKYKDNIATGAKDGTCVVWDLRVEKPIQLYAQHTRAINSVAFNTWGNFLISGSADGTTKGFDILEGRHVFDLEDRFPINSVAFDSTGDLLASASNDKSILVWRSNIESCNIITDEEEHSQLLVDTTIGYDDCETGPNGDTNSMEETKKSSDETKSSSDEVKKPTENNVEMLEQILTILNTVCSEISALKQRISTLEQKVK